MGYTIVRLKATATFKIDEFGPLQIRATFGSQSAHGRSNT